MKTTLRIPFSIALLALLAACGNKGPLVRPSEAEAAEEAARSQTPSAGDDTVTDPADDTNPLPPATVEPAEPVPPAEPAPVDPPADADGDG